MTIDYMLILAVPTLVGLYVLGKTIWVSKHPPRVEVVNRTMYVCPNCRRTFMNQASARQCSCITDPMSGDDNPYGMTHQRPEPEGEAPTSRVLSENIDNGGFWNRITPPFSPQLTAEIERTLRMGEELNESLHTQLDNRLTDREVSIGNGEVLQHYTNRNGMRELNGEFNIGDSQRVVVVEGPISQEQLETLRNSLSVVNEPEPPPLEDFRRLELS